MSDEDNDCPDCPKGLPGWLATFSDLMALLMCFFVLLLSFSEMDALKFKRLAGHMRNAFGVQSQINVNAIPKGTSIIAQQFSPGTPQPTPLNEIRQHTIEDMKDTLEILCREEITQQQQAQGNTGKNSKEIALEQAAKDQAQQDATRIASQLAEAIEDGMLQVETVDRTIIIRIREQSFGPGTDYVADEFLPILDKIREVLVTTRGDIFIEGHTDDTPVRSSRFRSNWALSMARALAVAEYLFIAPEMDESRFTLVGHGASRPLADNQSVQGREANRRVEIMIRKTNADFEGAVEPEEQQGETLNFGDRSLFNLSPDEIF